MDEKHREYLRRNVVVAKAVGVKCGLAVAINRMVLPKKYPKWLYEMLLREQDKMQSVVDEMVKHRDET